ncbi:MAG TPA: transcription termination/antitermination protein NusA, partial [Candidatus Sulfotelmatobacter sp.]|nr:transcription termination/antitermination protein NusA [Candidatus Sulfotelmatobacter sp.]
VQAIIQEFSGIEKIDIIQWQDNPKSYIAQSLSPAKEIKVEVNEDEKLAKVFVAPEELSLAIGKDGQNVRLASKLTGYRIEIEGDEKLAKEPLEKPKLEAKKEEKEVKEEVLAEEAKEVTQAAQDSGEVEKVNEEEQVLSQVVETATQEKEVSEETKSSSDQA